jgi:hypothetical protein
MNPNTDPGLLYVQQQQKLWSYGNFVRNKDIILLWKKMEMNLAENNER